jgi:hypothetical protein
MYNPPGDPRFPHGPRPSVGANGQAQQAYGHPPVQPFGHQPYGQQQAYAQQQPYAQQQQQQQQQQQLAQQPYGQQPYAQQPPYGQQPYAQPQPSVPPPAPSNHGASSGMPGMGAFGGLAGAGLGRAGAALPQVSGLPSAVAFGMGIAAVVVALVFDVIFLKVHIPGVGGYAWYLTTALSFAGAGYFAIKWTRATQSVAMTAVAVAGVLYGLSDIGLGLVLEDLAMGTAMFLGIQGFVIACVCGGGGVRKALGERD